MKKIFKIITPFLWLGIWELAALAVSADFLLPSPLSTIKALVSLAENGDFWLSCGSSLLHITAGLLIGIIAGTLFAVLSAASGFCKAFLSPLSSVIKATPVASFIILALVWLDKSKIPMLISSFIVIPVVWKNVETALTSTDKGLSEVAKVYKMKRSKVFRYIVLPEVLPYLRSAVLTASGMAWKAGIAAEVICSPHGTIGYHLYRTKLYFETPELFAWTLTVIILSIISEKLFEALLKRTGKTK